MYYIEDYTYGKSKITKCNTIEGVVDFIYNETVDFTIFMKNYYGMATDFYIKMENNVLKFNAESPVKRDIFKDVENVKADIKNKVKEMKELTNPDSCLLFLNISMKLIDDPNAKYGKGVKVGREIAFKILNDIQYVESLL